MLSKIMLCLLTLLVMVGCSSPAPDFQLVSTNIVAVEQAVEVDINNCGNPLPRFHWREWSESAEMGVDNLNTDGGALFSAIRKTMLEQHDQRPSPTQMTIPADTHVVLTYTVESIRFRGEVVGAAVEAQKEHPTLPTYYSYLAPQSITLAAQSDLPCP